MPVTKQSQSTFSDLSKLLKLRELLGLSYGSEDICVLFYSLIRREKPSLVVELGAGLGVTSVWMARALMENGFGHLYTVEDFRHSDRLMEILREHQSELTGILDVSVISNQKEYLHQLISNFGLVDYASICSTTIALGNQDLLPNVDFVSAKEGIDFLFSDFSKSPQIVAELLAYFLPLMSDTASIFIDSASTHFPSFLALETLISQLQAGKTPSAFVELLSESKLENMERIIRRRHFRLVHLYERKTRNQNSTAWIRIEPVDWKPPQGIRLHGLNSQS